MRDGIFQAYKTHTVHAYKYYLLKISLGSMVVSKKTFKRFLSIIVGSFLINSFPLIYLHNILLGGIPTKKSGDCLKHCRLE